ncbi:ABC transporter substrate-binding protein [Phreatobacter sp. AB_2022a]|uniref:ABC transporter substrate-binding protein n=1 Tax=Phreatobacter sp. AB_2022a TaxID=3003134 RepID=UPI00228715E8|nr:ABC transporter substrate-binding protein [Phreatobacter sp. AB_2022a]MCZ0732805.1 ABC transporter substrate-binding protein [Phreatobacter sp. AB_2022a]
MDRRFFMRSAAAAALSTNLPVASARAAEPSEFHIAGILAFSGAYGIIGKDMRQGAELAIADRGGQVLGKPIRVSWEDDETKPQPAVQKATRLLAGGAQMIFGAVGSASTLALQSLADQRKVPLLVTISADDKITRVNGSRYTFRTSNTLGMETRMALEFAKAKGLKKLYGVAADYQATRDGWAMFQAEAAKAGIAIVGIDYAPLGNRDFSVIVDKMAKSDADGIAVFVTGNDAVTFLKQSGQVGLGRTKVQFGPVLQDETLAAAVGPSAVGVYSGVRYHFSYDSPANKTFVAAYRAKYGEFPSSFAGEAYDGMSWWLDVVEATKSWDRERWVDAFASSTRENSLEGRKTMRACDHQAAQVGLWGVVTEGQAPLPPLTMKITNVFEPASLFDAC